MEKNHTIKLEVESKKVGLIVVEETRKAENEKSVIENLNSSMSVQAFPTSMLNLNATPEYPNLIAIKSGDLIRIYVKEDNSEYSKMFAGFITGVKIQSQKDEVNLEIDCTSEFYKLQERVISHKDLKNKSGLREILNQLVEVCGINGGVIVDDNVVNDYGLNEFRNFPALSLINTICYELDLIYDITKGDEIKFSKRKDVLHKMFNSKPIELGKDKIISSSFEQ